MASEQLKLILNMISTSVMIKLGKCIKKIIYGWLKTKRIRNLSFVLKIWSETLTGVDDELAEKLYERGVAIM